MSEYTKDVRMSARELMYQIHNSGYKNLEMMNVQRKIVTIEKLTMIPKSAGRLNSRTHIPQIAEARTTTGEIIDPMEYNITENCLERYHSQPGQKIKLNWFNGEKIKVGCVHPAQTQGIWHVVDPCGLSMILTEAPDQLVIGKTYEIKNTLGTAIFRDYVFPIERFLCL